MRFARCASMSESRIAPGFFAIPPIVSSRRIPEHLGADAFGCMAVAGAHEFRAEGLNLRGVRRCAAVRRIARVVEAVMRASVQHAAIGVRLNA